MAPSLCARLVGPALAVTVAAATVPSFVAPLLARASPSQAGHASSAKLTLVSQPPFYRPDDRLALKLRVTNQGFSPLRNLSVVVSAYDRVASRSALHEADAGNPGFATSSFPRGLRRVLVGPGDSALFELNEGIKDLPTLDRATSDGVYPLAVSLFDESSSEPIDTLYVPAILYLHSPSPPLNLALVAPINAIPERGPQGVFVPGTSGHYPLESAISRSGWLRGLLAAISDIRHQSDRLAALKRREQKALEQARKKGGKNRRRTGSLPHPGAIRVPAHIALGIAPTPETVNEIKAVADGYRRLARGKVVRVRRNSSASARARSVLALLRRDLGDRASQTLLMPYSYADLPSLVRNFSLGSGGLAAQIADARAALDAATGIRPSRHWFFPPAGRLGGLALDQLSFVSTGELTHTFFAPVSIRQPSPSRSGCPAAFGTLACPVEVRSEQGDVFAGYATDQDLQSLLGEMAQEQNGPLAIQRFLAETTMIREEAPGTAQRVVQASLPAFWKPSPALAHRFFHELALAPWLNTVTPSQGLHLTKRHVERRSVRSVPPSSQEPGGGFFQDILVAQIAINGFASMDPPTGVLTRLRRGTLVAQDRAWWRTPALISRGLSYPRTAQQEIDSTISSLDLVAARNITLTSKRGRIRLDLANGADYPLRASLNLTAQKLTFAGNVNEIRRTVSIKGGGQKAMDFKVASQASGVSDININVETPDGSRVITTRRLTVRSTNFNQIALGITLGALLFLILFYATRPFRRRRARRRASPEPEDPAGPGTEAPA